MNIEVYHEFLELGQRLNYSSTAKALHMSQSALSKHIQTLEDFYGTALFKRDRTHVELTAEGVFLLETAQDIWSAYLSSIDTMKSLRETKPLRIGGLLTSPNERDVVACVRQYLDKYGAHRPIRLMQLKNMYLKDQLEFIAQDVIDVSVANNLSSVKHVPDFIAIDCLCKMPLCAAVPIDSAFAQHESMSLAQLSGQTLIQLVGPFFTPSWRIIEQILNAKNITFRTRVIPIESVYDYLGVNLYDGILILPKKDYLNTFNTGSSVKMMPFDDKDFCFNVDVAYRTDTNDQSLQLLIQSLHEVYNNLQEIGKYDYTH